MRTLTANPNDYKGTYLIQSLNPPHNHWGGKIGPFDFGGGGSGLSQQAQEMICQFFSFDYMGAAEYEFGAVAQALNALGEFRIDKRLVAKAIEVTGSVAETDRMGWSHPGKSKAKTTVYVIGCDNHIPKIEQTIDSLLNGTKIQGKYGDPAEVSLKRGIPLWASLFDPKRFWANEEERRRFIGGLELDNGWMLFTDPTPFQHMCTVFNLPLPDISKVVTYFPPKALMTTERADKAIFEAIIGPLSAIQICNKIYDLNYVPGQAIAPEHVGYCQQVEKRLAVLARKKIVARDRKTKLYTIIT